MKITILFVVLDLYADWEAAYLSTLINKFDPDKYSVKTISLTKEPIKSMGNFTLLPDLDIKEIPEEFEGVILIGGMSWRKEDAKQVEQLVSKAVSENKIIGGICDATVFLGKMGILNDVKHTSNLLSDLQAWAGDSYTGAENYVNSQAVRDKNIITANGTATLEFAKEVLIALNIESEEKINEWYNFYKLGAYEAPFPGM